MHNRKRIGMIAWIMAALFIATPVVATAVNSSYGANYSYNTGNYKTMYACDRENDSNDAYALFDTISSGKGIRITDSGSSTACSSTACSSRSVVSSITGHKTCEDHDFAPDACGGYKYTQ